MIPGAGHLANLEQPARFNGRSRASSTIGYSRSYAADCPGALVFALCLLAPRAPHAQTPYGEAAKRQALRSLLDVYVRDGIVYYRALKAERAKLDGYVASLAAVPSARCRATSRWRSG